jgi:probable phosphoglycerate mutase
VADERFWLIRHAESTWNAEGRWQGRMDPPLSALGRTQAQRLAEILVGEQLEVLIASDLVRGAETAAILGQRLGLVPRLEPALREIDAGTWSGLRRAEIVERDAEALARFGSGDPDARAGGAESRREAADRARTALRAIRGVHPGRRIGVVMHRGVIHALDPRIRLGNAEWCVVESARLLDAEGSGG